MRLIKNFIFAVIAVCFAPFCAQALEFDDLSLDAKIAQVLMPAMDYNELEEYSKYIEEDLIGLMLLQWGSYSISETKELTDKLQEAAQRSPSKVPLLMAVDYEGGSIPTPYTLGLAPLPSNMMVAAAGNVLDCAKLFYLSGLEIRKAGIHINFSPVLDVNTNPKNPIIGIRAFSDDPQTVSKMGVAVIEGMHAANVMPVAKHFPGHGPTAVDSHNDIPYVNLSKADIRNVHLVPFVHAIKANVDAIMTTHTVYSSFDDIQSTFSRKVLINLLRSQMGYKGLIFSDSLDMKAATKNSSVAKAAVKSIKAGADVLIIGKGDVRKTHAEIKTELGKGNINEEDFFASAKKVFEIKKNFGLLDNKEPPIPQDTTPFYNTVTSDIAKNAITIIKDENKLIPVKKTPEMSKLCVVFFSPTRFSQDLNLFNDAFYEQGWDITYYNSRITPNETDTAQINACVKEADKAIIGTFQWAGLSNRTQTKLVNQLLNNDKPIILISLMSPYDAMNYPKAGTVLATYGINKFSSQGLAEVITGKIQAKGVLPVIF